MSFIESKVSVKIILLSLILASAGGFVLRLAPFLDLDFNQYNLRQAHSHVAFLGWVFSALIWLVNKYVITDLFLDVKFRIWFWVEFAMSNALFVLFIVYGYSKIPIIVLSLHTFIAYWGMVYILIKSSKLSDNLRLPLNLGVIGFILSSIGPMLVPFIQRGIFLEGHSLNIGVNFYLHFHYNAWFLFTVISILIAYLDGKGVLKLGNNLKLGLYLMFFSLFINFFDTLYWLEFPSWMEYLFFITSLVQIFGFYLVIAPLLKEVIFSNKEGFANRTKWILVGIIVVWEIKYIFEVIVNIPFQEWFNVANHFLQIAYLHWVFLGIVTPFAIYLFQEIKFLPSMKIYNIFFWGGWIGTELLLILMGMGIVLPNIWLWIAVYSSLMFVAFISLFFIEVRPKE